ncbi:hypothetical protein KSD_34210 [Ktedonobacter sp. SOSP1-85]|nr:hypothetical protein KSD_34210 [Ktedonobacter sp. SOSP1-85]
MLQVPGLALKSHSKTTLLKYASTYDLYVDAYFSSVVPSLLHDNHINTVHSINANACYDEGKVALYR